MSARPPRLAVRLLAVALRNDPAVAAILGDLLEDFHDVEASRGRAAARRWYWREALSLALLRPRASGSGEPLARGHRDRAGGGVRGLLEDAAYARRNLRGNLGFALFTALVMGLGIGAVTSVYSVMKPLVLAPLPFEEPQELVWIANESEPGDTSVSAVTSRSANLVDFRARSRSFSGLTGYNAFFGHAPYTLTGVDEPEMLVGADVAHDFLDVLGVEVLHGRSFLEEEGRFGGPRAVILSHGLWQRRFGADAAIVGRSLTLNDESYTVVGVLPASFDFSSIFSPSSQVDFLLPFPVLAAGEGGFQGNTLHLIGRLRPGVSPRAAQAELDAILAALGREDPDRWGLGAEVTPMQGHIAGPFRAALLLLAVAAAAFLLLVCVNVSNLILARSLGRSHEVVLRKALGASRGRLMRQLVVETLLISLAGAALGSLLAWQVTGWVSAQAGLRIPLLDGVGVDGAALALAVAVAVLAGLASGLLPAFRLADGREAAALRSGARGASIGRGTRRLREVLVVAQVACACVLLLITGLLVRSFDAVLSVDMGFDAADTVAWKLERDPAIETHAEQVAVYDALTERVAALPDVQAVGLIDELPLGLNRTWSMSIVGQPDPEGERYQVFPHVIGPGYLEAMRIPLRAGRNFTRDDTEEAERVILLNESGARRFFGGEQALGKLLSFWGPWEWRVVGIVQDVRHISPEAESGPQAYFPVAQMTDFHTLDMVVRSSRPVNQMAEAVGAALRAIDPSLPTREYWTVESTVDRAVSPRRFTLSVLAGFGAAALLIAGLGIYGVVAHSVAERVPEIGIRRALGAQTAAVVWGVMSRTLLLAGAGVAAGVALSLWGARLLASLVFGVGARDPVTFAIGAILLLAVATVAATVPALRAARTSALVALRRR